jgi:hypothetical protein
LLHRSGLYTLTDLVMSSTVFGRTEQMHQPLTFAVGDVGEAGVTLSPGMVAGIVAGILSLFCMGVIIYVVLGRRRSRARGSSESDDLPQTVHSVNGMVNDSTVFGTTEIMTTDGSELRMSLLSSVFSAAPPSDSWS